MARFLPAEIARRAGLNKSTVSRQLRLWPHLLDEAGTVDLDEYLAARAGGLDPTLQTRGPAVAAAASSAEPSELVRERTRKMAADAQLAEIQLRTRKGELVERSAIAATLSPRLRELRDAVLAVPRDRVTEEADAVACAEALRTLFEEFSDRLARLAMERPDDGGEGAAG